MVPDSYLPASWRCTLPVDPVEGVLGISFDYPWDCAARVRLTVADARLLADSLAEALVAYDASQSVKSSGKPSSDVSPEAGQKQ